VIEGVAWAGCVTALVSEPAAGKTFVLLDQGACISAGVPWHRRRVVHGSVAYLSFEANALGLRLMALREAGRPPTHIHILAASEPLSPRIGRDGTETPSIGETIASEKLADLATQLREESAPPIVIIMVDTISASLAGSENSAEVVAAYLRAVRRIAAPYPQAAVILAHHAGWQDGEQPKRRERGSSAFRGNVDGSLYLDVTAENGELGTADLTLTVSKGRDYEKAAPLRLQRIRVNLALINPQTGRPFTSCLMQTDPRTRMDLDAEVTRKEQDAQAELDAQALKFIRSAKGVSSVDQLRALLKVGKDKANEIFARLEHTGRVARATKKGDRFVTPSD
jgi:hypothetical protein